MRTLHEYPEKIASMDLAAQGWKILATTSNKHYIIMGRGKSRIGYSMTTAKILHRY